MVDDELLDRLQRGAFGYFVDQTNTANGLVADASAAGSDASIAVVGLALSSYPVAVERGWLEREEPDHECDDLRFFEQPATSSSDASGHGFLLSLPQHAETASGRSVQCRQSIRLLVARAF